MRPTLNFETRTLNPRQLPRRGFTLTELLIVIMIIGLMASLGLAALSGATELARQQRTRSVIAKLDQLVMERYEGYRTRAVPLSLSVRQANVMNPRSAALVRLSGLRALMRMELPDRRSDIVDYTKNPPALQIPGTVGLTYAALQKSYFRAAMRALGGTPDRLLNWTEEHEGAECLYLIISTMHDGDKNAIDFFQSGEIGDVDEDGMKEILDGWGRPIQFLRWAPAYVVEAGALTSQTINSAQAPDFFDPIKIDPRWTSAQSQFKPYALRPLIYSAGTDGVYDIDTGARLSLIYPATTPPNDPYYVDPNTGLPVVGNPYDVEGDGYIGAGDNITNQYQETP